MSEAIDFQEHSGSVGEQRVQCRPFLKWAGGKSSLLAELLPRMPYKYGRYFEPFLGGGALLFCLQPSNAVAFDSNPELINVFEIVKSNVDGLINALRPHRYEREYYYRVRDLDKSEAFTGMSAEDRAARFIYLNKTCFNGLYRVNSQGHFNVPFGRYENPTILDEVNLRACSKALSKVEFRCGEFFEVLDKATADDFIYFDPPYFPLSVTSSFAQYTDSGFDASMHRKLAEVCVELDRKGIRFMVSNSASPFVEDLFKAFRIEKVRAPRAINSRAERRGAISEFVIRNY